MTIDDIKAFIAADESRTLELITSMPSRIPAGIPAWRAKPLPEPQGMIPRTVSVSRKAAAVSLTVPSPPAANTAS